MLVYIWRQLLSNWGLKTQSAQASLPTNLPALRGLAKSNSFLPPGKTLASFRSTHYKSNSCTRFKWHNFLKDGLGLQWPLCGTRNWNKIVHWRGAFKKKEETFLRPSEQHFLGWFAEDFKLNSVQNCFTKRFISQS